MKKLLVRVLVLALCAALFLPIIPAQAAESKLLRVGFNYGSGALSWARLENVIGAGFEFGYYDTDGSFAAVGETDETNIAVVKTETIYLTSGGSYSTSADGSVGCMGPYHIQLMDSYESFEEARAAADELEGGFVAWINGTYHVRTGTYTSSQDARDGAEALGIEDPVILGTSAYSMNVVAWGTTRVLFQFDRLATGQVNALGVRPKMSETEEKPQTRYQGNNIFYGGFRFERISGGNMTVVNMVDAEDYVKGVIPYEMSASWPLEALKAQAVCARGYASSTRHGDYHFDVCTTTLCQVYYGTKRANDNSDRAVEETAGQMAYYNGKRIDAVYSASNGGGSESSKNVWGTDNNYLIGKVDPYEADVADQVPNYYWTKVYTAESLKKRLWDNDYKCADIVGFCVSKYSETGNAIEIKIVDVTGKVWTFSRSNVRGILGVPNIHFTIAVSGGSTTTVNGYSIAGDSAPVTEIGGCYAVNGDGTVSSVAEDAYVLTADGVEKLTPTEITTGAGGAGATYTISGAGNGHNVGLSQWGAYAMAQRGMSYLDILHFYYTDITVE